MTSIIDDAPELDTDRGTTGEPPATLGHYLDTIGRAVEGHADQIDMQTLHDATNLLAAAAGHLGDALRITSSPHTTPQVAYERTLGRLAATSIGSSIPLNRATEAALDILLAQLASS